MKTYILTFTLIIASFSSFAATYTCSNHPLGGSEFSFLSDVYNACSASGDTIILENTDLNYSMTFNWNKSIVVYGLGINTIDDRKSIIYRVGSPTNFVRFGANSSGSQFHGITFSQILEISSNDILFSNCLFSYAGSGSIESIRFMGTSAGCSFISCVWTKPGENIEFPVGGSNAVLFNSCIFNGSLEGRSNPNHLISLEHCLFLSNAESFEGLQNATIENSIFMNSTTIMDVNNDGNTFTNNIFEQNVTIDPSVHNLSGNLTNVDPLFVNFDGGPWDSMDDYDVQAGSPAIGAASDGTDIGLHGGIANFSEALEPLIIPIVTNVTIFNPTVSPNGTLNVQVEARTPLTD